MLQYQITKPQQVQRDIKLNYGFMANVFFNSFIIYSLNVTYVHTDTMAKNEIVKKYEREACEKVT